MSEESQVQRADPTFKAITRQLAEQLGLQMLQVEFPQMLRADLVLAVPQTVSTDDTLFDFCRNFNVLEFKGQEDELDPAEFVKNSVRVELLVLQNPGATFENTLNVFISSRLPRQFFKYMKARKCRFQRTPGKPWQWQARVGLQEVIVIVCRDLPVEPRYYDWLVFAPADSQKWRDLLVRLAREHNLELLNEIYAMRPKEYKAMSPNIKELLEKDPKFREEYIKDWSYMLNITPETLLKIWKPEEILAGLTPEEVIKMLGPEQREELLKLLLEREKQTDKGKQPE